MTAPARLITPDGKTIELSPDTYQQIEKMLDAGDRIASVSRRVSEIRSTYGKYAGKPSLVRALLRERKAELAREEEKLKRRNG